MKKVPQKKSKTLRQKIAEITPERKESASDNLNEKQIRFCQLYVTVHFGNGTQAYAEAYGINLEREPQKYNSVKVKACELLTDVNILSYIREILPEVDLNEVTVDKELMFVIRQNADFGSKVAAIREYNKLKQRITDKLELKGDIDISLKLD